MCVYTHERKRKEKGVGVQVVGFGVKRRKEKCLMENVEKLDINNDFFFFINIK